MPLQVGIIGAGIAGLSAAIGLRRAGVDVELFEQSRFKNEVGAAITMTPNGVRLLEHWRFDLVRARAVESHLVQELNWKTLAPRDETDFTSLRQRFGHAMYFFHRVDLHTELTKLATGPEGEGKPAVLRLGCAVQDIDCEEGVLTIEGGKSIRKDLIVCADGLKSKFPSVITKTDKPLIRGTRSAYRSLIPVEQAMKDPELSTMWKDKPPGFWVPERLEPGLPQTFCVVYPCRNGEFLNVALLNDTLPGDEHKEDWHDEASPEDVYSIIEGFHPVVEKLMRAAPGFHTYKMFVREPLETLVRGRAVVIGDAGHLMFPTYAQAAVLGLEEGGALEVLLAEAKSEDVVGRLKLFNDLLLERVQVVQILSNFGSYEEVQKLSSKPLFPKGSPFYSPPVWDFFYGYDVMSEAKALIAKDQSPKV